MANPKIEVEIGAVIDGLRKGFGESVKIIETLEKQALDLDKALRAATDLPTIQNLNTQLAQTKTALSQLKNSGLDPLTKATSSYNSVGVDFARIIQDAPFGIIGVGNNITQLAGSFQVLKNTTGSTGAAVKSALGSIFSSGNALVLGISLLTTAFTILQQKGFFDTEKKAKDLKDTLNEYKETLGETAQAQLEAANNADKEIVKITALKKIIEDESLSRGKRLAAVKQMREEAPTIFKNLSDEQILAGQVGDSYARLTQILLARATASSGINKIVALADEERIILEKNAATLQQISAFEQKAAKFRAQGQQELVLINENQVRYLKEQNPEIQRLVDIESERVKLTNLVNENLAASVDYTNKSGDSLKENKKALEKYSEGWDEFNLQQESARQLTDNLTFSAKDYEKQIEKVLSRSKEPIVPEITGDNAWDQYAFSVYKFEKASFEANKQITETSQKALEFGTRINSLSNQEVKINTNFDEFGKELADIDKSKLSAFVVRLAQFNSEVASVIEGGAEQTLGDFAFAIGDALASGGNVIKAGGAALLGGLAGILNQLGQLAIATGLAVEGIKKALQTLNPAVAIGAGVALIALAGFVSNKAKSLGGSKGGGGGGGGGGSSVGSSGVGGGSSFTGGAQGGMFAQNRDVSGEFVVRGTDLVYVLGQANNKINKG